MAGLHYPDSTHRAALLADSMGKDLTRKGSQGNSKKAQNVLTTGGKAKLQRAKFC